MAKATPPKPGTQVLPPTFQRAFVAFDLECDMTLEELHDLREQLSDVITAKFVNSHLVTNATVEPLPSYAEQKPDAVLYLRAQYRRENGQLPDLRDDVERAKEQLTYQGCCTNAHMTIQPILQVTRTSY